MRPDGTEIMGYLVHLIGDELAKILRRLRVAERDGRTDINRIWISLDYRKGRRFKIDADGLCEALAEISPPDIDQYIVEKRHQLDTLGYEGEPGIESEALIYIESEDHFRKLISGLVPLRPIKMQSFDRRFGIRIPYKGTLLDGFDEFPIELPRMGPCRIAVRAGPTRPAALFECEAFVPYPMTGGPMMSIKHPALSALFYDDRLTIETVGNFDVDPHELGIWIQLLRGLTYLSEGDATLELEFRGIRLPALAGENLRGPDIDQLPSLLAFVERLQRACEYAALPAPAKFSLNDVRHAPHMQMALDVMFNPSSSVRLEFDAIEGVLEQSAIDALHFNTVTFADVSISFAALVRLERVGDTASFVSSCFELVDIRPSVLDLDAYGAEMATSRDIAVLIDPTNLTIDDRPGLAT